MTRSFSLETAPRLCDSAASARGLSMRQSSNKAAEDSLTPKRKALSGSTPRLRQVLECGCPLPLCFSAESFCKVWLSNLANNFSALPADDFHHSGHHLFGFRRDERRRAWFELDFTFGERLLPNADAERKSNQL